MQTTEQHLAQPNRVTITNGLRVEFKPIYCHPFNGWEIVSVELEADFLPDRDPLRESAGLE